MPLNLHLLRMFATVVQAGSFSRAAEILNISQPAISKGVRTSNCNSAVACSTDPRKG